MIPEKYKSRKLWVTILAGALIGVLEAAGADPDRETIAGIVALALGYDVTQGAVDFVEKRNNVTSGTM